MNEHLPHCLAATVLVILAAGGCGDSSDATPALPLTTTPAPPASPTSSSAAGPHGVVGPFGHRVSVSTSEADNHDSHQPSLDGTNAANASVSNSAGSTVGGNLAHHTANWLATAKANFRGARRRVEDEAVTNQFSWLVELLPFLGHQEIYDHLDLDKTWTNRVHVEEAFQVIPEFQNPLDDRRRWQGYPYSGLA